MNNEYVINERQTALVLIIGAFFIAIEGMYGSPSTDKIWDIISKVIVMSLMCAIVMKLMKTAFPPRQKVITE